MILRALADYYKRMSAEDGVAAAGFERKGIPFLVVLNGKGEFVGLLDTREADGKNAGGRSFTVPKGVKKTRGIAANLLWDTPAYLFARPKPELDADHGKSAERAQEQQRRFLAAIRENFPDPVLDEGVRAVLSFLERGDFEGIFSHPAWKGIEESGCNLTFQLDTDAFPVCQRPAVVAAIAAATESESQQEGGQTCLVTGENDFPAWLHTSIKGVWGAQSSGANIVSFNHDAFRWFGKERGLNAPVGRRAEFAYTTALNTLLAKGSPQRMQVGDASTVFWAERKSRLEEIFADLFNEPHKENPDRLNAAVDALFECQGSGISALHDDAAQFYLLGLSPNGGRIAVRFWHAETAAGIVRHIRQHFDDCSMARKPHQPARLSLFRLLASTALLGNSDNIQSNLAGAFMKAIVSGAPYPHALLASVIRRCRADRDVTYPRAAIIKGVLARQARSDNSAEKLAVSLDASNGSPGYLMGRLFCALELAHGSAALHGINNTIRDSFYGLASSTPMAVFPHLVSTHYRKAKLENSRVVDELEKLIEEILSRLEDFPAHLNLHDQGRFAVGYYHQRLSFLTKAAN